MTDQEADVDTQQAQAFRVEGKTDRIKILDRWVAEQDDWESKSIHDLNDPARVSTLLHLGTIIPSASHQQPLINAWMQSYLRNRTAVGGRGRQDMLEAIKAAFGASDDDEDGAGVLARALGQADNGED